MRLFHWLCASDIPLACDLRRCGWRLAPPASAEPRSGGGVAMAHFARMDPGSWLALTARTGRSERARTLLLGVGDADERARLLRSDFGDVLGERVSLGEIEARAARVAGQAETLPRNLTVGTLRLDLFARDGFAGGRALGLHPREFALLWRLAEAPGVPVCKMTLLSEVWRLPHVPDTNSLAVHVSRLRNKLALAGLGGLVQTAPAGGYMLAAAEARAIPLRSIDPAIAAWRDRHVLANGA